MQPLNTLFNKNKTDLKFIKGLLLESVKHDWTNGSQTVAVTQLLLYKFLTIIWEKLLKL